MKYSRSDFFIVPSMEKLIGGVVSCGFKNTHDTLRGRFEDYDKMVVGIGRWLRPYNEFISIEDGAAAAMVRRHQPGADRREVRFRIRG